MLKVLFTGLGSIGQRHLRNLTALLGEDIQVMAYRTRRADYILSDQLDIERDQGLEGHFKLQVFTELEAALAHRPDVVFVTNPTSLHIPVARQAAQAGAHLFIEKPLSHNMEGVDELIHLVERNKRVAFVGFQLRFHPAFLQLQQWVNCGAIGRLMAAQVQVAEYLPGFHPYENYRQSYAATRELGGGVVLTQIHELDYLYAMFGMPRRLFSVGGKVSNLEIDVEDLASTLLEFPTSDGRLIPVHLHQDFFQRPTSRYCQIIGDQGKIRWDLHTGKLERGDSQGNPLEMLDYASVPRNQLFIDELKHFLDCLDGKAQPRVSLRDAANSLTIAGAILKSLQSGEPVNLD